MDPLLLVFPGYYVCGLLTALWGRRFHADYAPGIHSSFGLAVVGGYISFLIMLTAYLIGTVGFLTLTPRDRRNPFRGQLEDVIANRRSIQCLPGKMAEKRRTELEEVMRELRGWPKRLKEQEAERMLALMAPDLELIQTSARLRLAAYEQVHNEQLTQIA